MNTLVHSLTITTKITQISFPVLLFFYIYTTRDLFMESITKRSTRRHPLYKSVAINGHRSSAFNSVKSYVYSLETEMKAKKTFARLNCSRRFREDCLQKGLFIKENIHRQPTKGFHIKIFTNPTKIYRRL